MADTNNTTTPTTDPATFVTPDEAVQILRALQARIQAADDSRVAHIKSATLANVDPHFITASINAIGAIEAVQAAVGRTGDDARQEAETASRWTAFTDELRTMLAAAVSADRTRRRNLGLTALQTYSICKQLNRDKTRAPQVGAHLQEMKRLNKLGGEGLGDDDAEPRSGDYTHSSGECLVVLQFPRSGRAQARPEHLGWAQFVHEHPDHGCDAERTEPNQPKRCEWSDLGRSVDVGDAGDRGHRSHEEIQNIALILPR